jgi:hypothetical protein
MGMMTSLRGLDRMGTAGWLPGAGRGLIMGMAALLMATLAAPAMGVAGGLAEGDAGGAGHVVGAVGAADADTREVRGPG